MATEVQPRVVRFGNFEVDVLNGELRKAGLKLKLSGQPFQVLTILLERPGTVVTREELQQRLWPDTFVDVDHSLNTSINKIREVLGDSAESPRFVETLPRRGYRFIAPVEGIPPSGTTTEEAAPDQSETKSDVLSGLQTVPPITESSSWKLWLALAAIGVALGAAFFVFFPRHASEAPTPLLVAAIPPPPGEGFWSNLTQPVAVSPDGKFLAIIAMRNSQRHLWLRRLDSPDAQLIAGTEDATNPFWSPDSHYIGFFAESESNGELKKVDVTGGKVSDLCPVSDFNPGGSWSPQGVIVFASRPDVLNRVSDRGGIPEPIPGLAFSSGVSEQAWPTFLPDGTHFLYQEWRYAGYANSENGIWVGSLDGEKPRRLPLAATNVQYASGYLLFSRNGDLYAQKFDLSRLELQGKALPVARNIQYDTFLKTAAFSVSTNGILVYAPSGTGVNSALAWMDRDGNILGTLDDAKQFIMQSISPDGKRVAVGVKPSDSREEIWIYDIDRGTRIPLVREETGPSRDGPIWGPRWSPDGKLVAYRYLLGKATAVAVHASDGSGQERQVGEREEALICVEDWSPDGTNILFHLSKLLGPFNLQRSLRALPVLGDAKSRLEIENAGTGKFSPDGHWLAFDDVASGQIYVTPYHGSGGRIAVTSAGGSYPVWRGDGQELFYITLDRDRTVVSVQVHESPQEFRVLSSHPLFHLPLPDDAQFYDVTRDGKRFLVNLRTPKEQGAPLMVVTNWTAQF